MEGKEESGTGREVISSVIFTHTVSISPQTLLYAKNAMEGLPNLPPSGWNSQWNQYVIFWCEQLFSATAAIALYFCDQWFIVCNSPTCAHNYFLRSVLLIKVLVGLKYEYYI
jgi:hypothetical protein